MSNLLTATYGETINNIDSYGTFTLNTKGKFCQEDIVLEFVEQKNLINFYVNIDDIDYLYQAEEGMTWEDFVNSNYNNGDFIYQGSIICVKNGHHAEIMTRGSNIGPNDIIKQNWYYQLGGHSGGSMD